MPELLQKIRGTETKPYLQATAFRTHVLAEPRTIEVDLTKFGKQ